MKRSILIGLISCILFILCLSISAYSNSKSIPTGFLTISPSGWNHTYPIKITINYSENNTGDGDCNYTISRNSIDVGSKETIILGAGIYTYILNISDCDNYTANDSIDMKTLTIQRNITNNCNLLTSNGWLYDYGESTIMTCFCTGGGKTNLYFDGVEHNKYNNTPITFAATAETEVVCNITTGNYSSVSDNNTLVINKGIPIVSVSNGTHSVNTSGLVGYWKFESVNLSNYTLDSSGFGNDAKLKDNNLANEDANTSTKLIKAKFGSALEFDGIDDYVSVADDNSLNFGNVSFSASVWFKTTSSASAGLVLKRHFGSGYPGWRIYKQGGKLEVRVDDGPDSAGFTSTNNYNDGKWHHVVLVRNSTTLSLYADGDFFKSIDASDVGNVTVSDDLKIGVWGPEYFNGTIDEVMIFNRTLDETEIAMFYETKMYPGKSNISYNETNYGDSDINYAFYRNEEVIDSTIDKATLNLGYYYYFVNSTSGINYTKIESPVIPLRIEKPKNKSYCSLTSSANWEINNDTSTTISCSCTGDGNMSLYRDEKLLDENTISDNFVVGDYNFVCNITETENYTSASESSTLIVKQSVSDEKENVTDEGIEIKIISDEQDASKQSTDSVQYMILKVNVTNKNRNKTIYNINKKVSIPDNGTLLDPNKGWKNSDKIYRVTIDKLYPLEPRVLNIRYYGDWVDIECEEVKQDLSKQSTIDVQYLIKKCELKSDKKISWKDILVEANMPGECLNCVRNISLYIIDDFEGGDYSGWSSDCGGNTTGSSVTWNNERKSYVFKIKSSPGGDGLACFYSDVIETGNYDYIFYFAKGYNSKICIWNGSSCLNDVKYTGKLDSWEGIKNKILHSGRGKIHIYCPEGNNHECFYDDIKLYENRSLPFIYSKINSLKYQIQNPRKLIITNDSQSWSQKIIINKTKNMNFSNIKVSLFLNLDVEKNSLKCSENIKNLIFNESQISFLIPNLDKKQYVYTINFSTPIKKGVNFESISNPITGMFINFLGSNSIFDYIFITGLVCVFVIISYIYHNKKEKNIERISFDSLKKIKTAIIENGD